MLYCLDLCGNSSLSDRLLLESQTKQCLVVVFICVTYVSGHTVAQLVEALGYKPEGRGFDS